MTNITTLILIMMAPMILACSAGQNAPHLMAASDVKAGSANGHRSPLADAILDKDFTRAEKLLAEGADADDTADGIPLIVMATAEPPCSESLVTLLLESGANPDSVSPVTGGTAIMEAAGWSSIHCFERLMEAGADLGRLDQSGRNVVAYAAEGGNITILQALMDADVPLDQQAIQGVTPLMTAAYAGHKAFVEQLITSNEVKLCARDIRGRSARMMAKEAGHDQIVDLLPDCGD